MKPSVCFVTYEFFPTTRGGVGVLLSNLARSLLGQGHRVIVVLDVPKTEFDQFLDRDRLELNRYENLAGYHVDSLCSDLALREADFDSHFAWRSYRLHYACQKVYQIEHPDIIEFVDYCGAGYFALSAKLAGVAYTGSHIAVRLHTSIEVMDAEEAVQGLNEERYQLYALEHAALQLAETILYPSLSFLERAYRPKYGVWFGRTELATPPLVNVPKLEPASADPDIVLYYGRLFGLKGVDRFVNAAVLYLSNPNNPRLRFYLCGYDSNQAPRTGTSYQQYLLDHIPPEHRSAFTFTGHIGERELNALSPRLLCAVFPNHFESFCYAAHELYAAGVPLIVSPIPAFADFFEHNRNALVFDGTAADLCQRIIEIGRDVELRERLRRPYPVAPTDSGSFYRAVPPPGWMSDPEGARPATGVLLGVINDQQPGDLSALSESMHGARIIQLSACPPEGSRSSSNEVRLLGRQYLLSDVHGRPLNPLEPLTEHVILLIHQSDDVAPAFVHQGLRLLESHSQLGYVTAWIRHHENGLEHIDTWAPTRCPELTAISRTRWPLRCLLRIPPHRLLSEVFDPRLGEAGEVGLIWSHEANGLRGVCIPLPLIRTANPEKVSFRANETSFLLLNTASATLNNRLARYLFVLLNKSEQSTDIASIYTRLRNTEEALKQVESSLGWKLTLATRDLRQRALRLLNQDPIIGRRLTRAWLNWRKRMVQ